MIQLVNLGGGQYVAPSRIVAVLPMREPQRPGREPAEIGAAVYVTGQTDPVITEMLSSDVAERVMPSGGNPTQE